MKRCVLLLVASLFLGGLAEAGQKKFAIVVGNNRAHRADVETLRYADDDALAMHKILLEAGVHSSVLTSLDSDSMKMNPKTNVDGPPTWRALNQVLEKTFGQMNKVKEEGEHLEFYFFFSGHGDVQQGEGFVVLEDKRLLRTTLFEKILKKSPADRNHVFVDACKSYFLAFEKGKKASRKPAPTNFSSVYEQQKSNTGFVLSTNTARDSHEWERYQAGVFSHQLRSGLRGGADVNLDKQVSYEELAAFLQTANKAVANPAYRPAFTVVPPKEGGVRDSVLDWTDNKSVISANMPELGHLYVENAKGVRLLDWHATGKQDLTLHVPSNELLFVRTADGKKEYRLRVEIPESNQNNEILHLSNVSSSIPTIRRRGALHLAFESLFKTPFGKKQLSLFEWEQGQEDIEFPYLNRYSADYETKDKTQFKQRLKKMSGVSTIAMGAVGVGAHLLSYNESRVASDASHRDKTDAQVKVSRLNKVATLGYSLALVSASVWLTTSIWPKSKAEHVVITGLGSKSTDLGLAVRTTF